MNTFCKTISLVLCMISSYGFSQTETPISMKMNAGIVTSKLEEIKAFYTSVLNFGVVFENEFYLLLHTPGHQAELSFLLPNHPSQHALFQKEFNGQGVYLTIEVEDVDKEYERIRPLNVPLAFELKDEPWGDRHFAIVDPNGIGIDMVTYSRPD